MMCTLVDMRLHRQVIRLEEEVGGHPVPCSRLGGGNTISMYFIKTRL